MGSQTGLLPSEYSNVTMTSDIAGTTTGALPTIVLPRGLLLGLVLITSHRGAEIG